MTCVLSALRANKQLLKQNLSIFLDDPTMDWIIDSNKSRQGSGGAEGNMRGGKGEGSAGNVSFLQDRMKVLDDKLKGVHPCGIMERELQSNSCAHIKKNMKGLSAILERARTNPGESASGGSSTGRGGAFKSDTVELSLLDAADQVFLAFISVFHYLSARARLSLSPQSFPAPLLPPSPPPPYFPSSFFSPSLPLSLPPSLTPSLPLSLTP